MNVEKINRLSEEHKALAQFHKVCNHPQARIEISNPAGQDKLLNATTTQTIIVDLRRAIIGRIHKLEEDIKTECE